MVKGSKLYNKFIEAEKNNSSKPSLQKFKQFQHISKNNENVTKSVQINNKDENKLEEKPKENENLKFQNKNKHNAHKLGQRSIQAQNEKEIAFDKEENYTKFAQSEIEKDNQKKPPRKKEKGLVKDYTNPDIRNNMNNEIQDSKNNGHESDKGFVEVRVQTNKKNNIQKQIKNEPIINSDPESIDIMNNDLMINQQMEKNSELNSYHFNEPMKSQEKERKIQQIQFPSSNSKLQKDNLENHPHESISSPPYPELQGYSESIFPPNKFPLNNPSKLT